MKKIMMSQFVFGIFFLVVVLGGRLLFLCDAKVDRPSEVEKESNRRYQAKLYREAAAERMWQSYQQDKESERQIRARASEWMRARDMQLRRDAIIMEGARESYWNSSREDRLMRAIHGF